MRYDAFPETYTAPEPRPPPAQVSLRSWLLDLKYLQGAEQFAIRYADETEVHWSTGMTCGFLHLLYVSLLGHLPILI